MSARLDPDGAVVGDGCRIAGADLGPYTEIGAATILANVVMGAYSYCARHCDIANARIGRFANIASDVRVGPTDHPMTTATQHHFTYRTTKYFDDAEDWEDHFDRRAARLVHIGHDTWLGHGAIIKPDVMIGHGAVVAAGAIVTRDVAPYTIVAGVPAGHVRDRFDAATARRMIALAWWDWGHATLRDRLEDFRHLPATDFLDKYERAPAGPG